MQYRLGGSAVESDVEVLEGSFTEESFCSRSITLCSKVFILASSLVRFLTWFLIIITSSGDLQPSTAIANQLPGH